jgi:hypothetical protein
MCRTVQCHRRAIERRAVQPTVNPLDPASVQGWTMRDLWDACEVHLTHAAEMDPLCPSDQRLIGRTVVTLMSRSIQRFAFG